MTLRLRRHHVLCCIGFVGEGYDDAFVANMSRIVRGDLRDPDAKDRKIIVTDVADVICAPCPRRRGFGCEAQESLDRVDAAHGAKLGLTPGDELSWGDCLDRVRERVKPDDLDKICEGCQWLPLGLCKDGVARLLAEG